MGRATDAPPYRPGLLPARALPEVASGRGGLAGHPRGEAAGNRIA